MHMIRLGKTELQVNKIGFGGLPLQRVPHDEAVRIVRHAVENGINLIDTARSSTDSEEKIGAARAPDLRGKVILATKAYPSSGAKVTELLETSLKNLRTDYIDIMQLHFCKRVYGPGEEDGSYDALVKAREQGKVRFIGMSSHSADVALEAATSGFYDTVQFPLSYLSTERELEVFSACRKADVGFLAMKGLAGGLIRNIPAAFAFMNLYENALPLWGIQKMEELEEFIELGRENPQWDEAMAQSAEKDRQELGGSFCRGCGYCMPACPVGIEISFVARTSLFLGRSSLVTMTNETSRAKLAKAGECIECGECAKLCPYNLNTPELVRKNFEDYNHYLREHRL